MIKRLTIPNLLHHFLWFMLCAAHAAELCVTLQDPPESGMIVFMLYDSPNTFGDLRDPSLVVEQSLDGRAEFVITNLPPAEYALLAFYDENANGRIDKNFIGIPREPLGFSNGYRPKGPPSYARAAFTLSVDETKQFDINLYQPLGRRGRIGIGPGLIWQSSPYRGYDGAVYQVIPAITYTGNRLQWFGPQVQLGLVGSGTWRLAATARYRIGPYKEDGSDYLKGMGDAKSTMMAGLSLQAELPGGIDLSLDASTDALNQIGGHEASAGVGKSFQFGILRASPALAVNWMNNQMAANDYGVSTAQTTINRPAYSPGHAFSLEGRVGLFIEITRDWLLVGSAGVEWLGDQATDSPIVEKDYLLKGYTAVNYVF